MEILYLHGYASRFDPESDKVQALGKLGSVYGVNLDYGQGPDAAIARAYETAVKNKVDMIVGTSMGGWLASQVGSLYQIPFVALNPAVSPAESLKKYVGEKVNFVGHDCVIDDETVATYNPFALDGCGLVLCEEDDELIDARDTVARLKDAYRVELIPGGSHRFMSLGKQLHLIKEHLDRCDQFYERGYQDEKRGN